MRIKKKFKVVYQRHLSARKERIIKDPRLSFRKIVDKQMEKFSTLPRYCQMRSVLCKISNKLMKDAVRYGYSASKFNRLLYNAINFIESLQDILNPLASDSSCNKEQYLKWLDSSEKKLNPKSWIWEHRNVKNAYRFGEEGGSYWPISDLEELNEVCRLYLKKTWLHCGLIDRILVSAMVYDEALKFGEALKPGLLARDLNIIRMNEVEKLLQTNYDGWRSLKYFTLNLLKVLLIIIIGLGATYSQGLWAGLLSSFSLCILFKVGFYINNIEQSKSQLEKINAITELLTDMQEASEMMCQYPLSPYFVRERLIAIADRGAVWPMGIFPILDNAIARNHKIWG